MHRLNHSPRHSLSRKVTHGRRSSHLSRQQQQYQQRRRTSTFFCDGSTDVQDPEAPVELPLGQHDVATVAVSSSVPSSSSSSSISLSSPSTAMSALTPINATSAGTHDGTAVVPLSPVADARNEPSKMLATSPAPHRDRDGHSDDFSRPAASQTDESEAEEQEESDDESTSDVSTSTEPSESESESECESEYESDEAESECESESDEAELDDLPRPARSSQPRQAMASESPNPSPVVARRPKVPPHTDGHPRRRIIRSVSPSTEESSASSRSSSSPSPSPRPKGRRPPRPVQLESPPLSNGTIQSLHTCGLCVGVFHRTPSPSRRLFVLGACVTACILRRNFMSSFPNYAPRFAHTAHHVHASV
jgi:hypothetical protein